ncbi:MAG TPA: protein kinase [Candidatus Sulfotelmatobacter sp.]|nr:protein kinase [Candidatus Sulfotelmatobacter sp.]
MEPGSRIGPFKIVGSLGAGGMGEVFHAVDTRLERGVAIKILPAEFSTHTDRLLRFEQEAKSASALNHPNIVTIYELGRDGASHYIAMELVAGKTLRQLMKSGLLPMRQVLDIAVQVTEGLTKAHEAGITHRDLKPENLMVTEDGLVKILDFGLAKLVDPSTGSDSKTHFSSATTSLTTSGMVVGTINYMSPEQAEGGRTDFRADQFALGLVLYELVTGRRPFLRRTAAETLVAIMREQHEPIVAAQRDAPAPFCWAIERCLDKDPSGRFAATRELARELGAIRDCFQETPAREAELRPATLPVARNGFVGREREAAAARELLSRAEVRLVTITGPGGIGKTRLAVEVVGGLAEQFPGGVHFVQLSPLTDPNSIPSAIVQALGIREIGEQSALDVLKKYLKEYVRNPTLLVLDNFEHLLPASSLVSQWLTINANLKILVTSRAALHVYGEHDFPVPPLTLPDAKSLPSLEVLARYSGVALFVQRAAAAKPGFELTHENAAAVSEICTRLDGLPLAIELAAARVKVLSPGSLLSRLASRLQLLTGGAKDLPARQQTLRAAMDWSYDLLNPAEQKLFRRLSVFVGGCNLEGVEAVCDAKSDLEIDLIDGMASIVDKSLVRQVEESTGDSRFIMLETMREYALEKLRASGEEPYTRRAHAAYCLVLAEEDSGSQAITKKDVHRFESEYNNFRAALEWLTETGDAAWALRLGTDLFHFWEAREYLAEGRDKLVRILNLPSAAAPTKVRMRALFAAGLLASGQRDYNVAEQYVNDSIALARQLGDQPGLAVALNASAVLRREQLDLAGAQKTFEECLVIWRDLGDQKGIARTLSNMASVAKMEGEYERSRRLYAECFATFRALGDREGVAWSLNYQGDVVREQGDAAGARSLYERALAIFYELEDRWGIAGTLADLGGLARQQKDYSTAHSLYRESISLFREMEHKRGIARLLECFACTAAAQGHSERSLRLAGAAAALRQNIGAPLPPTDQLRIEEEIEPARTAMGTAASSAAWRSGWALPLDVAVDEALTGSGIAATG